MMQRGIRSLDDFIQATPAASASLSVARQHYPIDDDFRPEARERRRGWTAERLQEYVRFVGPEVIVLANREPYSHDRSVDGDIIVKRPASGLVTALEPVMRACAGVWVAHGSGTADAETVDARGGLQVPPDDPAYRLRRVWLTPEEERGYYDGFANEGLWPLCHMAHTRPVFRADDLNLYWVATSRFVDAVCEEATTDSPVVLVQDYHFAFAPVLLRERLPNATIVTFWHIPWPNPEALSICPWRDQLLRGLLGSDILGFQTHAHCVNFMDGVDRFLEARVDRERQTVAFSGASTQVKAYPISVDWPNPVADTIPAPAACRRELSQRLGLPDDARIVVGVDRLDYTKGIDERFLAVERLLDSCPSLVGQLVFVQIGAPSREKLQVYRDLRARLTALADQVNERFGSDGYQPIKLLVGHHDSDAVCRLFKAADVCYVGSLHDGMNLVAKEFVTARNDEQGVLVLSQFAGAARELTDALIVNPYDLDGVAGALNDAINMDGAQQRTRMCRLRTVVARDNVYKWAGQLLTDAVALPSREAAIQTAKRRPAAVTRIDFATGLALRDV